MHATLVPTVSNKLIYISMYGAELSYWEADGQPGNIDSYDFASFILTTEDGTRYLLEREDLGEHLLINVQILLVLAA